MAEKGGLSASGFNFRDHTNVTIQGSSIDVSAGGSSVQQHTGSGAIPKSEGDGPDYYCPSSSTKIFISKGAIVTGNAKIFEGEWSNGVYTRARPEPAAVKVVDYTEKNCRESIYLRRLLRHDNVVTILESDTCVTDIGKKIFITMEKCHTQNLEDYIKDRKEKGVPFNLQQAFSHARQVVDGIRHIHNRGIVHRDLKPSSVLFSICGKYLKIADFGLSKELKQGRSVMSVSMLKLGTDGYRAPEIYNEDSKKMSKMSDIFSLGLVLFYLWSYGLHPFGSDDTSWNYNIKNQCQKLDMSGLLLPNPDNAKYLLEQMFKFEPKQRITIDQVRRHAAIKEEISRSVTSTMEQIWKGKFQGTEDLACTMYQMPSGPDMGLAGADSTFKMNAVSRVKLASMKSIVDRAPTGYIATWSKRELKKLAENFNKEKTMGWADVHSSAGERKALLLMCSQDFPELFGIFVQDLENFTSRISSLISAQELDISQQTPDSLDKQIASDILDKPIASSTKTSKVMVEEEQSKVESTPANTDIEQSGPPELIPWWDVQILNIA